MSFSQPFFNSKPVHYTPNVPEYDSGEHWIKTLERRPVGQKYGPGYPPKMFEEDRDTRIDNFDEDFDNVKEMTQ